MQYGGKKIDQESFGGRLATSLLISEWLPIMIRALATIIVWTILQESFENLSEMLEEAFCRNNSPSIHRGPLPTIFSVSKYSCVRLYILALHIVLTLCRVTDDSCF